MFDRVNVSEGEEKEQRKSERRKTTTPPPTPRNDRNANATQSQTEPLQQTPFSSSLLCTNNFFISFYWLQDARILKFRAT